MAIENAAIRQRWAEQEKMAAIGRAMAFLSHDIRNILTQIKGGSELLQLSIDRKDALMFPEASSIIVKASVRLSDLVIDMLEFAKPKQVALEPCNITALLEEISGEIREQAKGKTIDVALATHARNIMVDADKPRLYRCLYNVALNGLQAIENAGKLSIETREVDRPLSMGLSSSAGGSGAPNAVQISISDTGCGISPEIMDKIFTPFFTTKKSKGTGLGLPIAKQIVEEHGGVIHVASRPSAGTTFKILLPMKTRVQP